MKFRMQIWTLLGWFLLLAGVAGIAVAGVQSVLDQRVDAYFDRDPQGPSVAVLGLGAGALIAGILLLVSAERRD